MRQMHGHVQRGSLARRKGDGKEADSEDTESEEEPEGEMNDFQDLQLESTTPVVCHEAFKSFWPPHLTIFLQDMDQPFVL